MNLFAPFKKIRNSIFRQAGRVNGADHPRTTPGGSMKKPDLVFVDIETTGMNPRTQEIIEIAVLRVSQEWTEDGKPSFSEIFSWSVKIKPEHIERADPAALRVNGYVASEWKHSVPLEDALREFSEKTDGAIMVAHNVAFDSEFLNFNLLRYGIPNKMHYHRLDTVSMAYAALYDTAEVTRYSLVELCKYFQIPFENPHSALPDVHADFALFKKILAR